jgi:hypothetical protein
VRQFREPSNGNAGRDETMIMHSQSRRVSKAWRAPQQEALANQRLIYSVILSVADICVREARLGTDASSRAATPKTAQLRRAERGRLSEHQTCSRSPAATLRNRMIGKYLATTRLYPHDHSPTCPRDWEEWLVTRPPAKNGCGRMLS